MLYISLYSLLLFLLSSSESHTSFYTMKALRLKLLNCSQVLYLDFSPYSAFFLFLSLSFPFSHNIHSKHRLILLVAAQLNSLALFNFLCFCIFVSHLQLTLIASYLLTHHDIRTYIYIYCCSMCLLKQISVHVCVYVCLHWSGNLSG